MVFEENLDEENRLITYSSLKNLMERDNDGHDKKFKLQFSAHDKKGDVFLQRKYEGVSVIGMKNMKFSYRSGTKIIRHKVRLQFEKVEELLT